MLDDVRHWVRVDRRSGRSTRDQILALVILGLLVLSILPLFACPCGGSPRVDVVAAPSDDVAYLQMIHCPACRDTGRWSLADRWFRDPPAAPPVPPTVP